MVTTNDLRSLVKTDIYTELLDYIVINLNLTLNENQPPGQVFNIYANTVNCANLEISDLEPLCLDKEKVLKFIEVYSRETKDEKQDEDDDSETIEIVPSYNNFLIGYLVDYYMLKNKRDELEVYLKKRKVPGYKQFANKLRYIYEQSS
jgi:hypothetical protein